MTCRPFLITTAQSSKEDGCDSCADQQMTKDDLAKEKGQRPLERSRRQTNKMEVMDKGIHFLVRREVDSVEDESVIEFHWGQ